MSRCRRLAVAAAIVLPSACQRPPPPAAEPTEVAFEHPGVGVSFSVPAAWTRDIEGEAVVFAGPAGTAAYFATLTLQASAGRGGAAVGGDLLERVLDASYRELVSDRPPRFIGRSPVTIDGATALRYFVAFDYAERDRLRTGVLVDTGAAVVDLGYAAPAELFAPNIEVFERAVETFRLDPSDQGSP